MNPTREQVIELIKKQGSKVLEDDEIYSNIEFWLPRFLNKFQALLKENERLTKAYDRANAVHESHYEGFEEEYCSHCELMVYKNNNPNNSHGDTCPTRQIGK